MSTQIKMKPLPHKVGTADIKNVELKRVAMLFMENFNSLHGQVRQLYKAVEELQRKGE